ncbi:MAG TPA: LemA family protein [Actinopolymorphaceae bacterium]|mgnify:CR=1 FL=1
MIWIIVVVAIVVLLAISMIVSYNRFVSQRNLVQESWRQIDVELHRRYDLIPNLVECVKGYAEHERAVFDRVTALRSSVANAGEQSLAARAQQESELSSALRQLFAVVENYPVLKSDQNFRELQRQLAETEDRVAAGRRFYNANVRAYNTRVEAFPSNLIAKQFGFRKAEYFEVEEAQVRAAPAVDFGSALGERPNSGSLGGPTTNPAIGSTSPDTPDPAK